LHSNGRFKERVDSLYKPLFMVRCPFVVWHNTHNYLIQRLLNDLVLMVSADGGDRMDEIGGMLSVAADELKVRSDFAVHTREQGEATTTPTGFGSQRCHVTDFVSNERRPEVVQNGQHDSAGFAGLAGLIGIVEDFQNYVFCMNV
jgi:hypothetical protein